MHFEFKKTSFILANLGAFFLTAFTVWFFIMTYSITFIEDNLSFSSFFDVAFNLTFFLSPGMFLIVLIPSYILSYQYWKYSQNLELTVGDGYIEVLNNNSTEPIVIKKSDIQKIVSVQSMAKHHRLFSQFSYLVIFKEGNEIILPCFVVTQKDFFNCFGKYDNLGESYPFTPFIKPKNYVGKNKIPEFSLPKLTDKPIKLSGTQFELLRLLVIAGLAFYTFTAYFVGQTWFIGSFAVTLAISLILCLHKKVLIAENKLIAKIASDDNKPNGLTVVDNAYDYIGVRPVSDVPGIGRKTTKALSTLGIHYVADIRDYPLYILKKHFKSYAYVFKAISQGRDASNILWNVSGELKSVGNTHTMDMDTMDRDKLKSMLSIISEHIAVRMNESGVEGNIVCLVVRYKDFHTFTKRKKIYRYIRFSEDILIYANSILDSIDLHMGVRLIGISISGMRAVSSQMSFDFTENARINVLEDVIADIKSLYGEWSLMRGSSMAMRRGHFMHFGGIDSRKANKRH